MSSNHSTTIYSFLDFQFIPCQHQLVHLEQPIQLSKKNHELLLALVKSQSQVLEKDQLIDLIWPGQIVTDAALNKQITRLRQTLAEFDDASIIETIRGVGIRFVPEIQTEHLESGANNPAKNHLTWVVVSLTLVAVMVLWLLNKTQVDDNADWQPTDTINMAIMPSFNNNDWLNIGGLNYLSERLLDYQEIQTIQPENSWFEQGNQDVFGIELTQLPGIEYVLMVENQKQNNQFLAKLLLRNKDQIIAKQTLQADNVSMLLNQIETWTLLQLDISAEVVKNQQQSQPKVTDFVMESYLRGLAAARSRDYEKAEQLLNTAVEQDPTFYPAWFTLADVESEMGHFDKALGLINTLISSGKLNQELSLKLAPIQVKNLIYLNRLDEAQTLLDQSMQQAKANQDINTIMYNMNNQLVLNDYRGIDDERDITLSMELLALTEQFDPAPNQIGARQHNLAVILNEHSREQQAIAMIQLAIQNFAISNNYEGLLSSYRVWSDIHAYLAQFGEAKLVLEKAEPYLPQVDGARTLVNYWRAYGWVHYELGDLTAAQKSIDVLNQLSIDYANLQPKVKALVLEADMGISYGQYKQSRLTVDALLEIVTTDPENYPIDAPYAVALDLYLLALMQPIEVAKAKRAQYLSAYPGLAEWIENELMLIDALILAADGFQQQAIEKLIDLENRYIKTRDISFANNTNYVILDLLTADLSDPKNKQTAQAALDRLADRDHFAYPFNKFKAQFLAHQNKLIQAISLMSELKAQANDFWTAEDQLLLESWQAKNSRP